jgi:hypothetical protein
LGATAIFAFLWVFARACSQSITIDEADTYLFFVGRPYPSHWDPSTNNHLLNSLLMRLVTSLFGLSNLAVRLPALIGAAIYITSSYVLCRRFPLRLAWPVLACLVFNPLVMDHLVAARGYSLAVAFLMVQLTIAAGAAHLKVRECAICSACAALSFAANFSFAVVSAAMLIGALLLACRDTPDRRERGRVLAACVGPGLAVSLLLSIHAVLHFPVATLTYGAHTVGEMFGTVRRSSLYHLNPHIVNPTLLSAAEFLAPYLLPAVLALAAWQFRRRQPAFAYLVVGVLAAAILGHLILLKTFHVLLPKDRTAIWLVPLLTLAAGAVAIDRRALRISLYALSVYYLLCLRLHSFKEWDWDADVQDAYPVLAWYNHEYGVTDIASNWQYGAALNFYRVKSGRESMKEIASPLELHGGYDIYVLNFPFDEEFLKRERLRIVYHGLTTDMVVAVRSSVEKARGGTRSRCPALQENADPVN